MREDQRVPGSVEMSSRGVEGLMGIIAISVGILTGIASERVKDVKAF